MRNKFSFSLVSMIIIVVIACSACANKQKILIKLKSKYYKPIKGRMTFEELESYLYNSTDLGLTIK